jgi:DNA primase
MFHQLMVERLAALAHTASGRLAEHLEPRQSSSDNVPKAPARQSRNDKKSAVRQSVEILLHQPSLATNLETPPFLEHCDLPGIPLLLELLDLLRSQPELNTAAILEHWRGREESRYLSRLASWTPELDNPDLLHDLQGLMLGMERQHIEKRMEFLNQVQARRKLSEAEIREYWELHQQSHAMRQRG